MLITEFPVPQLMNCTINKHNTTSYKLDYQRSSLYKNTIIARNVRNGFLNFGSVWVLKKTAVSDKKSPFFGFVFPLK